MMRTKKFLYFDTEFTSPIKNSDLISIGITTDDKRQFYAELTDFDITKANRESRQWLSKNVLAKLLLKGKPNNSITIDKHSNTTYVKGGTEFVRNELWKWLEEYKYGIQLVTDCGAYDMVLLQNLLSNNPVSLSYDFIQHIELNQVIMDVMNIDGGSAADISREELSGISGAHNALTDAIQIKEIFNKLTKPINSESFIENGDEKSGLFDDGYKTELFKAEYKIWD